MGTSGSRTDASGTPTTSCRSWRPPRCARCCAAIRTCGWWLRTPTARSSRKCTGARRRPSRRGCGGTSRGCGGRPKITSRISSPRWARGGSSSAPDSRCGFRRTRRRSSICWTSRKTTEPRSNPAMSYRASLVSPTDRPSDCPSVQRRLEWGLVPAVPVLFRKAAIADDAQRAYAAWMATQPVAGVAVWAHTGRGPHLSAEQRGVVLAAWRGALADKFIIDDATLHGILSLPNVIGIKVATLDSVITFQRIAAVVREHPDRLLITGEDRFLGYSIMMGARGVLIGMGSALTDLQARLLASWRDRDYPTFFRLTHLLDAFGSTTFAAPVEGYVRRMLWALAADGVIPEDACDDPWGPPLPAAEREAVRRAVRDARAARA